MKYCDGEMERLGLKELRPILVATSTHGASAPHSSSSKDKDTEDEVKLSSCLHQNLEHCSISRRSAVSGMFLPATSCTRNIPNNGQCNTQTSQLGVVVPTSQNQER